MRKWKGLITYIAAVCLIGVWIVPRVYRITTCNAPRYIIQQTQLHSEAFPSLKNNSNHSTNPVFIGGPTFVDGEWLDVFRKVPSADIYVYSAIHSQRNPGDAKYTRITLTSLDGTYRQKNATKFKCCGFVSGEFREFQFARNINYRLWGDEATYMVTKYVCEYPAHNPPTLVALGSGKCPPLEAASVVVYTKRKPGSVALCLPHIFGEPDSRMMVEWVEYVRLMGVDKVFAYFDKANQKARDVLAYYSELGFIEVVKTEFPGYINGKADRDISFRKRINPQFTQDTNVVLEDCLDRTSGYQYVAVHDLDELFVSPIGNYKDLLRNLTNQYPTAGGFTFHQRMFPLDWKASHPKSNITFLRHRNCTPVVDIRNSPKSIHLPLRIRGRNMHWLECDKKYKCINVPGEIASVHHYRNCRTQSRCMVPQNATKIDTQLVKWKDKWTAGVNSKRNHLIS